jgi:hypothetical protein
MEQITTYDKIVQWALNNPIISIIVVICTILIAIPQVRDGIVLIIRLFWPKNNQKEFVIEYADEIITFEEKLISQNFDIIKINATTHMLGVRAEREWLNKKYPGYENNMQMLTHIETKQGRRTFDILPISKGNIKKDIYFDITDFFDGASVPYHKNTGEYAVAKINQIYQ